MSSYVVVSAFETSDIGRALVRALEQAGVSVGAIETRRPSSARIADAPVKLRGATVVHQAALHDLPRSLAQHPTPSADRRVAYFDWRKTRFEERDLEILLPFDEVWVMTHLQRELATASGLPRARVHTIPDDALARAVLERDTAPLRPTPDALARILAELGLKTPDAWLAGSRSRVELCAIQSEHDDWRSPLRRFLERHGPDDDVTLCLWIDADLAPLVERLAAEAQAEIDARSGPKGAGDVLLLTAPLEHVPWDRVKIATAA